MSDYISRDAALNCFHDWIDQHGYVHTADEMPEYDAIADLPAADVVETDAIKNLVEVVMCRDCKRYTENCFCEFWQKTGAVIQMSTYDFCSYGERREE